MAFNDAFRLLTWSLDGAKSADITSYLKSLAWSGSYADCARQLTADILPTALCDLGGAVRLYHDTNLLFSGRVFERSRDSSQQFLSPVSYDWGIYLKRNKVYLPVRKQTPEAITQQLCRQYGISVGSLAATGVALSRNFLGSSIYQVIQTLYTLAAEQTGKQYQVRFTGDLLNVVIKQKNADTLRLIPGNNLLNCSSIDSITDMVNSVAIYDDDYKRIATYKSPEGYAALYGLMEEAIKASKSEDSAKTAKQLLEDNGIKTTITAQCIGNPRLITGNTVVVHEPTTGTDGLFWILSDSHTKQNGIYQAKLTLDFRNLMDKQEAGSVPTK